MNKKLLATETLVRALANDEPIDNIIDDISSRLGQTNGSVHSLNLERLSYITLKDGERDVLRIFGPNMFRPTHTESDDKVRNLLGSFLCDMQVHNSRDLEITAKPGFFFLNIRTGFYTQWEIRLESKDTVIGVISEIGNFYDRNTSIEIDLPRFNSVMN